MSSETTVLLRAARSGDARAADQLLPLVYAELRQLAQSRIDAQPVAVTLSATGLVHEAYLRLVDSDAWEDRTHFLAVAARALRMILIDRARARQAEKRGGAAPSITLQTDMAWTEADAVSDVLDLDAALGRLAARDADLARVVELRFFGGLDVDETAEVMGLSPRTTARYWARAKAYLRADLG